MGRPRRSELAPLFRSEAQGRVLASIFLAPEDAPPHVAQISSETGLPYSTVQREVTALERAGVIRRSPLGNAKVVRPEPRSAIHDEVAGLVLKSYGPAVRLADALHDARPVRAAYIFGSWAARYSGERGHDPGDIDVLVVLDEASANQAELEDALAAEADALGRDVNVVFTTETDWANGSSAFLRTLKSRPLVALIGGGDVG